MDSNKVTLPRDVAEALELLTQKYGELAAYDLAQIHSRIHELEFFKVIFSYARYNPKEYFSALVNGYNIEQTEEEIESRRKERVRSYYREMKRIANAGIYGTARAKHVTEGIERTLDMLEIKIEGVNA